MLAAKAGGEEKPASVFEASTTSASSLPVYGGASIVFIDTVALPYLGIASGHAARRLNDG
jgi:hypothetical protein